MALAVQAPRTDPYPEEVMMAYSSAGDVVARLGAIKRGSSTLAEMCYTNPLLIRKWDRSTGKTPDHVEQRAFAKVMLTVIAAHSLDGPPTGAIVAVPRVALAPAEVVPGGAPEPKRRRKVKFSATVRAPAIEAGKAAIQQASRFWNWAPVFSSMCIAVVMLGLLRNPDLAFVVPAKVLQWTFAYGWFVLEAWCTRVVQGIDNLFGHFTGDGMANSSVVASQPHQILETTFNSPVCTVIGWTAALAMYLRQD